MATSKDNSTSKKPTWKTKRASDTQCEKWKKEYETEHVHEIEIEEFQKRCYMRQPKRSDISQAAIVGAQDPLAFNLSILESCWITGDEDIKTHDGYFMSVSGLIGRIVGVSQATLKKR